MRIHGVVLREMLIVFLVASVAYGQEGWKSKPYQQWTKQDLAKLGSESPWAQVQQADVTIGAIGKPANYQQAVTIQLRSSMHMRQALVRLRQLEQRYDRMNDKERGVFDAKMKATLDCPVCAEKYIVALGAPMSGPGGNPVNT